MWASAGFGFLNRMGRPVLCSSAAAADWFRNAALFTETRNRGSPLERGTPPRVLLESFAEGFFGLL